MSSRAIQDNSICVSRAAAAVWLVGDRVVPHLHVVDALGREVDVRELLDDLVEQVPLVHARDVLVEPEALHDLEDVVREVPDVAAEVLGDVVRSSSSRAKSSLEVL